MWRALLVAVWKKKDVSIKKSKFSFSISRNFRFYLLNRKMNYDLTTLQILCKYLPFVDRLWGLGEGGYGLVIIDVFLSSHSL